MWASRQSSGESFQQQARSSQLSFVGQLPLGLSFPTSKMKVTQLNQQLLSLLSCGTLFSNETCLRRPSSEVMEIELLWLMGAKSQVLSTPTHRPQNCPKAPSSGSQGSKGPLWEPPG